MTNNNKHSKSTTTTTTALVPTTPVAPTPTLTPAQQAQQNLSEVLAKIARERPLLQQQLTQAQERLGQLNGELPDVGSIRAQAEQVDEVHRSYVAAAQFTLEKCQATAEVSAGLGNEAKAIEALSEAVKGVEEALVRRELDRANFDEQEAQAQARYDRLMAERDTLHKSVTEAEAQLKKLTLAQETADSELVWLLYQEAQAHMDAIEADVARAKTALVQAQLTQQKTLEIELQALHAHPGYGYARKLRERYVPPETSDDPLSLVLAASHNLLRTLLIEGHRLPETLSYATCSRWMYNWRVALELHRGDLLSRDRQQYLIGIIESLQKDHKAALRARGGQR